MLRNTELPEFRADAPRGYQPNCVLLLGGALGSALFTGAYTLEGARRPGFDATRDLVSHLSLGPDGWFASSMLVVFGASTVGLGCGVRGLLRDGPGSRWGPRLISLGGAGFLAAGIFGSDPGKYYPPGAVGGFSTTGTIHQAVATVGFASIAAAAAVFARRFTEDRLPSAPWAAFSAATAVAVAAARQAAGVARGMDSGGAWSPAPAGLFERIALLAVAAWLTAVAIRYARDPNG